MSGAFLNEPGTPPLDLPEGGWLVQGHVPVEQAQQQGRRINLDTGAHFTGRSSAVRLSPADPPAFLGSARGAGILTMVWKNRVAADRSSLAPY